MNKRKTDDTVSPANQKYVSKLIRAVRRRVQQNFRVEILVKKNGRIKEYMIALPQYLWESGQLGIVLKEASALLPPVKPAPLFCLEGPGITPADYTKLEGRF